MKMVDDFANELTVVPIYNSLNVYAKEKAKLRREGNLIDDFDILIGVTAIANDLVLVSENAKHLSQISKVKIENRINRG